MANPNDQAHANLAVLAQTASIAPEIATNIQNEVTAVQTMVADMMLAFGGRAPVAAKNAVDDWAMAAKNLTDELTNLGQNTSKAATIMRTGDEESIAPYHGAVHAALNPGAPSNG